MLFPKRRALRKKPSDRTPEEADMVAPLAFLAASYRPQYWYFEVTFSNTSLTSVSTYPSPFDSSPAHHPPPMCHSKVIECFRKLLLSAALIFITPGSATQGLFALLMAQGSQRLYVGCKQFPNPADNRLGELAQWQLVFIFLGELDGANET